MLFFLLLVIVIGIIFVYTGLGQAASLVSTLPLNVTGEINTANAYGFDFNSMVFLSGSSSMCKLVQISPCENNIPNQFACINTNYYQTYLNQKQALSGQPAICSTFLMMGAISCVSLDGYCEVADNESIG